jgi:disulfide bond formation protein DsbB
MTVIFIGGGCGEKEEKTTSTAAKPAPVAATPPASTPPAPAQPAAPSPAEILAEGKKLFGQSCAACHGPEGKGLPNLGKDMTTSTFIKGLNDDELLAFIKKGRPSFDPANTTKVDMPPKGGNTALTDDQLKNIIAYIRSLTQ